MGTGSRTTPATARTSRQILFGPITNNRRLIASGTPLIVLWQMCEALVPVMIGVTIDVGIETGELRPFPLSCLAIVVIFTFLSYGYRFGATFMNRAVQLESHRIRLEIAGKAVQPADDPKLAGEWLSLATSDADKVSLLVRQFGFTVASLVTVTATAIYLARTDMTLALVILFGLPVTVGITQLVSPVVARTPTASSRRSRASRASVATWSRACAPSRASAPRTRRAAGTAAPARRPGPPASSPPGRGATCRDSRPWCPGSSWPSWRGWRAPRPSRAT